LYKTSLPITPSPAERGLLGKGEYSTHFHYKKLKKDEK
jgi:hypothetical protein